MSLHALSPKIAKLHRWSPAFLDLLRRIGPRQTVEGVDLIIRLAGCEMKQERTDRVAIWAGEPVEVFLSQILKSSQYDPAHPVELRDQNTNLGTKSLSWSKTENPTSGELGVDAENGSEALSMKRIVAQMGDGGKPCPKWVHMTIGHSVDPVR